MGHLQAGLAIVPQNPEVIIARIFDERSRNFLSRFMSKIDLYFYRRSNNLSPLIIPQGILPISIDELIAMLQERFASELREYHITVREWQE